MNQQVQNQKTVYADDGYRPNVGIILSNNQGQVFWARRISGDGWQFPQGGLNPHESLIDGMYRELLEETGIHQQQVQLLAHTNSWLHYDLPKRYLRRKDGHGRSNFKGQKQIWFMLRLLEEDIQPNFELADKPEFDHWEWINYWYALDHIVSFKRDVYQKALSELEHFLPKYEEHEVFEEKMDEK